MGLRERGSERAIAEHPHPEVTPDAEKGSKRMPTDMNYCFA
jgi:hypothetical protein